MVKIQMDHAVVVPLLAPVDDAGLLGILIEVEEEVVPDKFHLVESLGKGQGNGLEDLFLDIDGAVPGDFHVARDLPGGQDLGCIIGTFLGQDVQDLGDAQAMTTATTISSLDELSKATILSSACPTARTTGPFARSVISHVMAWSLDPLASWAVKTTSARWTRSLNFSTPESLSSTWARTSSLTWQCRPVTMTSMTTSCIGVRIGVSDAETNDTTASHPPRGGPGTNRSCHAPTLAHKRGSQQLFGKVRHPR